MQRILTIALFLAVLATGAAFSAINTGPVAINYYLGTLSIPLSVVIVASLVFGIVIGALAIFISTLRLQYENRRLHKKLDISEQEINSLRILPVKEEH
jgi:putative membrane protein